MTRFLRATRMWMSSWTTFYYLAGYYTTWAAFRDRFKDVDDQGKANAASMQSTTENTKSPVSSKELDA